MKKITKENKQNKNSVFRYKEQFGIVVICKDEKEQKKLYEKLLKEGYKLKVVVV